LIPIPYCALGHVSAEMIDNCGDAGMNAIRTVDHFSNTNGEREHLDVHELVVSCSETALAAIGVPTGVEKPMPHSSMISETY